MLMCVASGDRGEPLHFFFGRRNPLHAQGCMPEAVFAIPVDVVVGPCIDNKLELFGSVPLRTVLGVAIDKRLFDALVPPEGGVGSGEGAEACASVVERDYGEGFKNYCELVTGCRVEEGGASQATICRSSSSGRESS
jgi:hypothetical protein